MSNIFTYSILKYKPSLLSGEVLNVGILFVFYNQTKLHFVYDNTNRLKQIYHDFDRLYYNNVVEYIDRKTKVDYENLFDEFPTFGNIGDFIYAKFLPENSTSLQFAEPVNSIATTTDISKIINDFTNLFLPYYANFKEPEFRKDEAYINRSIHSKLVSKNVGIDNKITRGKIVSANKVEVNFDYAWPNEKNHLVKSLSFDLKEKQNIQNKIVLHENYFKRLYEYAKLNNNVIDVLTVFPQDEELLKYCLDKIELLKSIPDLVKIYVENQFDTYVDDTISGIQHHFGLDHSDN